MATVSNFSQGVHPAPAVLRPTDKDLTDIVKNVSAKYHSVLIHLDRSSNDILTLEIKYHKDPVRVLFDGLVEWRDKKASSSHCLWEELLKAIKEGAENERYAEEWRTELQKRRIRTCEQRPEMEDCGDVEGSHFGSTASTSAADLETRSSTSLRRRHVLPQDQQQQQQQKSVQKRSDNPCSSQDSSSLTSANSTRSSDLNGRSSSSHSASHSPAECYSHQITTVPIGLHQKSDSQVCEEFERAELEREIKQLREEIGQMPKAKASTSPLSPSQKQDQRILELQRLFLEHGEWKKAESLPWNMGMLCLVNVKGNICAGGGYTGYFGWKSDVVVLNRVEKTSCLQTWKYKLPPTPSPTYHFGLVSCSDRLYLIGGRYTSWCWFSRKSLSNQVFCYDFDAETWSEPLPRLRYPREYPGVVDKESYIVVAGGLVSESCPIEIINTSSSSPQWWQVKNWHNMVYPQLVVAGEHIYIGGDRIACLRFPDQRDVGKKLYSIPIEDLLLSHLTVIKCSSWIARPNLPASAAALVCYKGQLLSIGGIEMWPDCIFSRNLAALSHIPVPSGNVSRLGPGLSKDFEWKRVSNLTDDCFGSAVVNTKHGLLVSGGFSTYRRLFIACICLFGMLYLIYCGICATIKLGPAGATLSFCMIWIIMLYIYALTSLLRTSNLLRKSSQSLHARSSD